MQFFQMRSACEKEHSFRKQRVLVWALVIGFLFCFCYLDQLIAASAYKYSRQEKDRDKLRIFFFGGNSLVIYQEERILFYFQGLFLFCFVFFCTLFNIKNHSLVVTVQFFISNRGFYLLSRSLSFLLYFLFVHCFCFLLILISFFLLIVKSVTFIFGYWKVNFCIKARQC